MRPLALADLDECQHCGWAIAPVEGGWLHLKAGYGVSGARFCASTTQAEPAPPTPHSKKECECGPLAEAPAPGGPPGHLPGCPRRTKEGA